MLQIKIPKKNKPAAGTEFSLRPAIGPTYEYIRFHLSGGLQLQHIKNISVDVRGKPIQMFKDGKQLERLNKAYKRPQNNAVDTSEVMTLWFYRPELDDIAERKNFSLGTADVDTLAITFDIDAAAPAGSDIDVTARTSAARQLGVITKIKQYPQTFAQAGEQDIADIPLRDAAIAGIHCDTAHVNNLRLELDSLKVVEGSTDVLAAAYDDEFDSAGGGFKSISYLARGTQYDALSTENVQDFRLSINLTQADTFPLMVEYFDTYAGL